MLEFKPLSRIWDVGVSSATGVPRRRHFEAHSRRSGLVGLYHISRPPAYRCCSRRAYKSDLWKSAAPSDFLTFEDLCSSADEELFTKTSTFSNHIFHAVLPPLSTASPSYSLRQRTHSFQLPGHSTHLSDCNFLTRMLYNNCY